MIDNMMLLEPVFSYTPAWIRKRNVLHVVVIRKRNALFTLTDLTFGMDTAVYGGDGVV